MKKLSIRKRGVGTYEVGSASHKDRSGRPVAIVVNALDKHKALVKGKAILKARMA